jgi:2-hydroxychromene-2-carboxylate isomerase
MPAVIDYYFTSASPFVYLGHEAFLKLAAAHEAKVNIKAVVLPGIWEHSGAVPLPKRPPVRQRYRLIEMQRAAHMRGMPINLHPKFFPVDPALADRAAIALIARGADPTGFMRRVFASVWANEENIADTAILASHLEAEGHDAATVLSEAGREEVARIRAQNTEDAVKAGAIGVPLYVLDGEPFWGQDRLPYLEHALATGRGPFSGD